MKRRHFLLGAAACAAALPLGHAASRPTVGVIATDVRNSTRFAPLSDALRAMGYVEGRTVEFRLASAEGDPARLPQAAAELLRSRVDVVFASGPAAIRAMKAASSTVPIVALDLESDPVAMGWAASLARPGGNVTGIDMLSEELNAKRLETLIEAVPGARRIAVLDSGVIGGPAFEALRPVAARNKVDLVLSAVPAPRDYAPVFGKMSSDGIDALLVPTSTRFYREQAEIIAAAAAFRMPTMYEWGDMARNGGLIGYGPDLKELVRRCVSFIDRILKGAKPGTLPVEQPREYELVINAKTAEALPLALPQELLRRANDVVR